MSKLDTIVDVQISKETETVDRENFGIPLFAVTAASITNRVKAYANIDEVADDYSATDNAYKMASAAFSQDPRPKSIKIGEKTAAETWADALTAMVNADDDWYALAADTVDADEIDDIATFIEARTKIFIARTSDSDVITNATDDVATLAQVAEYDRTAIIYHALATTEYPDAAWLGNCLTRDPGSQTWKFKELKTITPTSLTSAQKAFVLAKGANLYERVAGASITQDGTMAGGEFIDVIRGIDWLTARIKERIFTRLINAPKIPYTNAGIAVIESAVREQLDIALGQDLIAPEPPYTVTVPDVLATDELDRQNRQLKNVNFRARLAGAIHNVEIRGTVYA